MKVDRNNLNLIIPVNRSTDPDNPEAVVFHIPPMDDEVHLIFGSDLIRGFDKAAALENIQIGMYGFMDFVRESIMDRLGDMKGPVRIEKIDLAVQAGFIQFGKVICAENGFKPVSVNDALDSGLIDQEEYEQAVSAYGFFSRALRSPFKGFAKATATTMKDAQSFAASMRSDSATSSPVAPAAETSTIAEIQSFTDSTSTPAPSSDQPSASSTRAALVTGFN